MTEPEGAAALGRLRARIDSIDEQLHALIRERATLVGDLRRAKTGQGTAQHPAREALILRRLAEKHDGTLPFGVVARIWRELIGSMTALQQDGFTIALTAGPLDDGLWDLARNHFGSHVKLVRADAPTSVLRALSNGDAHAGILPLPEEQEPRPWWQGISSGGPSQMRIVARLPFLRRSEPGPEGLVVSRAPFTATGDDHSFVVVELKSEVSRSRLRDTLNAVGLPCDGFCSARLDQSNGTSLQLVEVADFVDLEDPRLERFVLTNGADVSAAWCIGGYAVPLTTAAG